MKKWICLILSCVLMLGLAACGNNGGSDSAKESTPAQSTEGQKAETEAAASSETKAETKEAASEQETEGSVPATEETTQSDTLVVVFSATGTTKGVADKIASITGADLYEITAAQPYTSEDLNYHDSSSRSTKEQNDKNARPEIGSADIDLKGYKTIYIGFPIWWGEEPRIMDTFVESHSFDGITVIPFCTSASSGIGRSGPNMEALAKSGNWLNGKRFGGNVSEDELRTWIDGLK